MYAAVRLRLRATLYSPPSYHLRRPLMRALAVMHVDTSVSLFLGASSRAIGAAIRRRSHVFNLRCVLCVRSADLACAQAVWASGVRAVSMAATWSAPARAPAAPVVPSFGAPSLSSPPASRVALRSVLMPLYMCFIPGTVTRGRVRAKYALDGSCAADCATYFFCALCAVCQEAREIRARGTVRPRPRSRRSHACRVRADRDQ